MKHRRIIRSFFIILLLLSLGSWMVSCARNVGLRFYSANRCWWMEFSQGRAYCGVSWRFIAVPMMGWRLVVVPFGFHDDAFMHPPLPLHLELLGFGVEDGGSREIAGHPAYLSGATASIPFWFLTTLATLALLFAWRKTRKPNPAMAFPVEMAARNSA